MVNYPLHLVLHDHVQRCRDALLEAMVKRDRVSASARMAEAALRDAVAHRNALAERAAREGNIPLGELLAARQAVADSESHCVLLREAVDAAQRALDEAAGEAHMPVLEHAINERIRLAAELDQAELHLMKVKGAYQDAAEVAAQAVMHGARHPNFPTLERSPWGRFAGEHEEAERRAWGRPPKVAVG